MVSIASGTYMKPRAADMVFPRMFCKMRADLTWR